MASHPIHAALPWTSGAIFNPEDRKEQEQKDKRRIKMLTGKQGGRVDRKGRMSPVCFHSKTTFSRVIGNRRLLKQQCTQVMW